MLRTVEWTQGDPVPEGENKPQSIIYIIVFSYLKNRKQMHLIFTDTSSQSSPVLFQMRTERLREGEGLA